MKFHDGWRPRLSIATIAGAMNIDDPGNFERLRFPDLDHATMSGRLRIHLLAA
ncbi:MAG: hypothetical protein OEW16_12665 [Gammaproteobacteria bacterium]|nr:hypothetical protein [Gammaproteobacteria bacterium]